MNFQYKIRTECIFCESKLINTFFQEDLQNFVAHYAVDTEEKNFDSIPFNIFICDKCNTPQNKYLADPKEVYRINHADSTGSTMIGLHKENLDFILKYKDEIKNIIEIGSALGVLGDFILEKLDLQYNIIDPSYIGNRDNKIIYEDFYENVDDSNINANTIIISHVFEHFYNPKSILEKINKNSNIQNIFVVFPDLEYYVNNNVLHLLNTEHTYYVDNDFLIKFFDLSGFEIIESKNYKSHSVLFYFKRKKSKEIKDFDIKNSNFDLKTYFDRIYQTVSIFNKVIEDKKNVYLWPASVHTLYLIIFGLDYQKLKGFLDNSSLKIGKNMYGTNKKVNSFYEKIKEEKCVVLMNGGVFNSEIESFLNQNNVEYHKPIF